MFTRVILSLCVITASANAQEILSSSHHKNLAKHFCLLNSLDEQGTKSFFSSIRRIQVSYDTVNQYGEPIKASGLIALDTAAAHSVTPMLYLHPTSSTKKGVPSNAAFDANYAACKTVSPKLVMIAPDYEGLGYGDGTHSYLVKKQTVRVSLDLLTAAKKYLKREFGIEMRDEVILSGYSQGAHAAMAIHQAIDFGETHHGFEVMFTAAMSGPYNLSTMLFENVILNPRDDRTSHFAALIMVNFQSFYGDIYASPEDAFRKEYLDVVEVAEEFDGKKLSGMVPATPELLLTEDYFAQVRDDETHPLRLRLKENDITAWQTDKRIYLGYSKGDGLISYHDTLSLYSDMRELGSDVVLIETSQKLDHTINFIRAMKYLRKLVHERGL